MNVLVLIEYLLTHISSVVTLAKATAIKKSKWQVKKNNLLESHCKQCALDNRP